MSATLTEPSAPRFWRDPALPFIEARSVQDGRQVCYSKHYHDTFSIGLISQGRCKYINSGKLAEASVGTVVLMNPGDVHACNPLRNQPWSYRMLYMDVPWLRKLQDELDITPGHGWVEFSTLSTEQPELYGRLNGLFDTLFDPRIGHLEKECASVSFVGLLQGCLGTQQLTDHASVPSLARAAEYIRHNRTRSLKLQDICAAAGLSPSHLVRAFRAKYGLTPHAYQLNCRIELCRSQLRAGHSLADVALEAGFADQPHFQRTFKRFVAATPRQYQRALA